MTNSDAATSTEVVSFDGVGRGPRAMRINGRPRPAYEWCEMFGHVLVGGTCKTCGGLTDVHLGRLAEKYGWGSKEVQDAYDYEMGTTPDE